MGRRRVVVTGMGVLSPVGSTVEETWGNMVAGVSGAVLFPDMMDFTDFPFSTLEYPTKIAAPVKGFDPAEHIPPKQARRMARFSQLAVAAAQMAVADADLAITPENADRVGVLLSNSIGSVAVTRAELQRAEGARLEADQSAVHGDGASEHGQLERQHRARRAWLQLDCRDGLRRRHDGHRRGDRGHPARRR